MKKMCVSAARLKQLKWSKFLLRLPQTQRAAQLESDHKQRSDQAGGGIAPVKKPEK